MKVIFIAGPFRGPNAWAVESNVRQAEALALEVWKRGAVALCPHTNTRFFQDALPDEVFLSGAKVLLARCDAVLVTPNWSKSLGTQKELAYAAEILKPVLFTIAQLENFLKE